jgi:hypothetical protein
MPKKKTLERARRDRREGRAPSTQAGEFVREQIEDIREGKHGARSTKQAIAIGLSQARRAGVDLPPPAKGKTSERTRKSAARAYALGHGTPTRRAATPKRARASEAALKREGHDAASHEALAAHARSAARAHTARERSAAALKAVRTKGPTRRATAARKAAHTRAMHVR